MQVLPAAGRPPLAPAPKRPPVPLDELRGYREMLHLGPNRSPQLIPLAPFNPAGPPIVFVHGLLVDPSDERKLIEEAQRRGLQVWTVAYDTVARGLGVNGKLLARELERLSGRGVRDLTIVGHSMGGMLTKAALNELTDEQGRFAAFDTIRFVSLAVPWGGISLVNALPDRVRFAADIASDGDFWPAAAARPFSPQVAFSHAEGERDEMQLLDAHESPAARELRAGVLAQARDRLRLNGAAHISILQDPRLFGFVFDQTQPPPAGPSSLPRAALGELREVLRAAGIVVHRSAGKVGSLLGLAPH